MTHWYDRFGEFDETPDENPEEFTEKEIQEQDRKLETFEEMGVLDEWWAESIKDIENPKLREKAIDGAQKILDKENSLDEKLESGEISKSEFDHENLVKLGREKARFSTRCDLESEGITYDHLGDLSEDWEIMTAGDLELAEKKQSLKKMIELRGPKASQELADEMLAEGKISKNTHNTISRQIRLNKK